MTKNEILLAQRENLFPSVFHFFKEPLVIDRAKDQYVWDADGNQYLDFFGGIVTISVGHCNDEVNKKLHAQIDRLQHVSTVFANEPQAALAKKLAQITPGQKLTKSFFTISGTEANETAVQTARACTPAILRLSPSATVTVDALPSLAAGPASADGSVAPSKLA